MNQFSEGVSVRQRRLLMSMNNINMIYFVFNVFYTKCFTNILDFLGI